MRFLLILTGAVLLGIALCGCTQTYNTSEEFDKAHPEYGNKPDYYNPNTDDNPSHTFFGTPRSDDHQ